MPGDAAKLSELESYNPESPDGFSPLLDFLWDKSSIWWEAFSNWDDFLDWANDQYGSYDVYRDDNYGIRALGEALDAGQDPSVTGKYSEFQQILAAKWKKKSSPNPMLESRNTPAAREKRRKALMKAATVGQLAKKHPEYGVYNRGWEYAYDHVDQIYLYRAPGTSQWDTKLPPYARYTDIAKYGDTGWWYGLDTQAKESDPAQHWRYIKSPSEPTGDEDAQRWLTYQQYAGHSRPVARQETTGPGKGPLKQQDGQKNKSLAQQAADLDAVKKVKVEIFLQPPAGKPERAGFSLSRRELVDKLEAVGLIGADAAFQNLEDQVSQGVKKPAKINLVPGTDIGLTCSVETIVHGENEVGRFSWVFAGSVKDSDVSLINERALEKNTPEVSFYRYNSFVVLDDGSQQAEFITKVAKFAADDPAKKSGKLKRVPGPPQKIFRFEVDPPESTQELKKSVGAATAHTAWITIRPPGGGASRTMISEDTTLLARARKLRSALFGEKDWARLPVDDHYPGLNASLSDGNVEIQMERGQDEWNERNMSILAQVDYTQANAKASVPYLQLGEFILFTGPTPDLYYKFLNEYLGANVTPGRLTFSKTDSRTKIKAFGKRFGAVDRIEVEAAEGVDSASMERYLKPLYEKKFGRKAIFSEK